MPRADDSSLTPQQFAKVRSEAVRALNEAGALGCFPTPVDAILAAANVEEVKEDVLNEDGFLARMRRMASDAGAILRSALSKVLGLFDARAKLVFIDRTLLPVRQTFIRLHESGHAFLPWQRGLYAVVEDCEKSLDPDVADLFDREANVFATEVLFQGDAFSQQAADHAFSIKTPLKLKQTFGASFYATVRQYVAKNDRCCAVLVLEMPKFVAGDGMRADLRRAIPSPKFLQTFGASLWPDYFTSRDQIGGVVPLHKRRMSSPRPIRLRDLNGDMHECIAEAFTNTYQVFVLIHDQRTLTGPRLILPGQHAR